MSETTWCLICRRRCGGGSLLLNIMFGAFSLMVVGGIAYLALTIA